MFALRRSAVALRLRRTVGSFELFSSYPDSCSHSLPSPPPKTRVLAHKAGKCEPKSKKKKRERDQNKGIQGFYPVIKMCQTGCSLDMEQEK